MDVSTKTSSNIVEQAVLDRNLSLSPVHINNWLIVFPNGSKQLVSEFVSALQNVGAGMNMQIADPIR